MKSYELFFDVIIYRDWLLKMSASINQFLDRPLEQPPLLIVIFKDEHLNMLASENRLIETDILKDIHLSKWLVEADVYLEAS